MYLSESLMPRVGLAWCGFVTKRLLKSREKYSPKKWNGGGDVFVLFFCLWLFWCVLFVFHSLDFCLQRYFFLDRGILKYSKCRADVSDLKPFKAFIK